MLMNKNVGEPISFLFHVNSSFPFELSRIIFQNFGLTTPNNHHSSSRETFFVSIQETGKSKTILEAI